MAARILNLAADGNTFHGEVTEILSDGRYVVSFPISQIHLMACWVLTYCDWETRFSPVMPLRERQLSFQPIACLRIS